MAAPKRRGARRATSRSTPPDPERLAKEVAELREAVLKIQDYLLRTSERFDHILSTLKNHRELLVKMNQRVYQVGTRERIRMELDIMKNTLSILAMNAVEVDDTLLPEIEKLRTSAGKEDADIAALRRSKDSLDKRFDSELKKYDLTAMYRPRAKDRDRDLPGYG